MVEVGGENHGPRRGIRPGHVAHHIGSLDNSGSVSPGCELEGLHEASLRSLEAGVPERRHNELTGQRAPGVPCSPTRQRVGGEEAELCHGPGRIRRYEGVGILAAGAPSSSKRE
jgi:hypothetical protein